MEKTYEPHDIEQRWYQIWEQNGWFAPSGDADANPYCIMIPPPNVTGHLHMGHAFQDTLMDLLVRYHRMKGDNTLWQAGTDHAGIATQMVVERRLAAEGKSRHALGREAFVETIWGWKAESGGHITRQLRRLGASLDWSRERFTMDDGLSEAVREVFVRLYDEGLIYRGKRLVNWDPVLHTAISDLEVVNAEEDGFMWHLRYPLVAGSDYLIVATTRPETMLGDAAVAVHPEDERYQHLIGQQVALPLTGRAIPVIADDYVDPGFGTGCVKITPAHDFNDYQVGERHKLPKINVLTIDAAINDNAPEAYRGLDRFEARRRIVADLDAAGLIEKIDDHKLMVPRGDRSHAVVEPFLTDQWYVSVQALADPAIKAVEDGDIRFVPGNWSKTYFEWMRNIEDWCISRQLWWGHRIPAWYDEEGNVYVGRNEDEARGKYGLEPTLALTQDEDVLDTWFSSALWPFSTLGWPEQTAEYNALYPTSVLVTGFDIIFFWVARMIMMGLKFTGEVPFREIYIHGLIRDSHGHKMSKSKGNVLDPIDLIDGIALEPLVAKRTTGLMQPEMAPKIEQHTRQDFPDGIPAFGTDALRFTFAALASHGRDINFDLGRIGGYRNFCNKLWNAARFVLMNTEGRDNGLDASADPGVVPGVGQAVDSGELQLSLADRWILSRFEHTRERLEKHIDDYRFDLAAQAIYEFTWNEFCDWYLELSKPVLANAGEDEDRAGFVASAAMQRGTRRTLARVLEQLLRLIHPFMPFITEEIWQRVAPLAGNRGDTIMLQPWPTADSAARNSAAEQEMAWVMAFVQGVRAIRGDMNLASGKPIDVVVQNGGETDRGRVARNRGWLMALARLSDLRWLEADEEAPMASTALVGEMKVLVPMAGLIDTEAERVRLDKELAKLEKNLVICEGKLANPRFVDNAPAEIVGQERGRVRDLQTSIAGLREQREAIAALESPQA